jgi:hypothetical protein
MVGPLFDELLAMVCEFSDGVGIACEERWRETEQAWVPMQRYRLVIDGDAAGQVKAHAAIRSRLVVRAGSSLLPSTPVSYSQPGSSAASRQRLVQECRQPRLLVLPPEPRAYDVIAADEAGAIEGGRQIAGPPSSSRTRNLVFPQR